MLQKWPLYAVIFLKLLYFTKENPMFADLHVHMLLSGSDWKAAIAGHQPYPDDILIRSRLSAYRTAKISYLRDGGDRFGVCLRARELAPEYGITYHTPAFPIYKKGHYGSFIGRGWSDFAEYRALLTEAQAAGADFIKLMVSGLMDFSACGVLTEEPLTGAEIHDLIAAAHDAGFAVMAHCNGAEAVKNAVIAGVDSIEHGAYPDDEACHILAESDTVWVPTLSTIGNLIGSGRYDDEVIRCILRLARENVRKVANLGGHIGLGCDAGAFHVPHVEGTFSEERWLRETLGNRTDVILSAAERQIRAKF